MPVRTFLEIARPTDEPVPAVPAPAGLELVPWSADLDEEARLAHVEAFADHWGSEPRSAEEWAQWYTGHRAFRPDLSVLAVDRASGQVASLVLIAAYPQDWDRVPGGGVDQHRRHPSRVARQGRGPLAHGRRAPRIAAADTGFVRAILGVDSENPTGALRVYREPRLPRTSAPSPPCRDHRCTDLRSERPVSEALTRRGGAHPRHRSRLRSGVAQVIGQVQPG